MTQPATAPPATSLQLDFDVLVIGWGKGGKTLAARLGADGTRVGMVEQFEHMHGGTCINIACVPTKTLVHEAGQRRQDDDAPAFWDRAVTRRDTVVGTMREVNHSMLADLEAVTLVSGRARFTGDRTVEVTQGTDVLTATAPVVVINTGATPVRPELPGIDSERVHDSTSIQHADPLPARLAVVGAGPVGLEFASMFAGAGTEVTLIDRHERLLPGEDEDVAAAVTEVLEGDGITILSSASVQRIDDGASDGIDAGTGVPIVQLDVDGRARSLEADAVLLATGRRPATDDLGLETAGVDLGERGAVVTDAFLRTTAEGVYAIGDVRGGMQETYLSLDDFRIVLDQLRGDGTRSTADRVAVPATTFITPPLASVGLTEREAREAGYQVLVATQRVATIAAMPRPKIVGDPRGIVTFVVEAGTDRILGARLLHVDAQEVINLVALAMRTGTTAAQLNSGIWIHPSSAESLNETLGTLAAPR